jgi:hypothetical protein
MGATALVSGSSLSSASAMGWMSPGEFRGLAALNSYALGVG